MYFHSMTDPGWTKQVVRARIGEYGIGSRMTYDGVTFTESHACKLLWSRRSYANFNQFLKHNIHSERAGLDISINVGNMVDEANKMNMNARQRASWANQERARQRNTTAKPFGPAQRIGKPVWLAAKKDESIRFGQQAASGSDEIFRVLTSGIKELLVWFKQCMTYEVNLDVEAGLLLAEGVRNHVKGILDAYDKGHKELVDRKIKNFFDHYGTHFSEKTQLGGRHTMMSMRNYRSKSEADMRTKWQTAEQMSDIMMEMRSNRSYQDYVEKYSEDNYAGEVFYSFFRGAFPGKDANDNSHPQKGASPIKYHLRPIYKLFTAPAMRRFAHLESASKAKVRGESVKIQRLLRTYLRDLCLQEIGITCMRVSGCSVSDECTSDEVCKENSDTEKVMKVHYGRENLYHRLDPKLEAKFIANGDKPQLFTQLDIGQFIRTHTWDNIHSELESFTRCEKVNAKNVVVPTKEEEEAYKHLLTGACAISYVTAPKNQKIKACRCKTINYGETLSSHEEDRLLERTGLWSLSTCACEARQPCDRSKPRGFINGWCKWKYIDSKWRKFFAMFGKVIPEKRLELRYKKMQDHCCGEECRVAHKFKPNPCPSGTCFRTYPIRQLCDPWQQLAQQWYVSNLIWSVNSQQIIFG